MAEDAMRAQFIERLDKSLISSFVYLFKFSRIRSYITTVSFIEYPTIVKTAAIIERLISKDSTENIPIVIITSWNKATIDPTLNCHSNRIQI